MQNLNLPKLEYLNLGGNHIKNIEHLDNLKKLHTFEIHKNELTDINNLSLIPSQSLSKFNAAYNLIPL